MKTEIGKESSHQGSGVNTDAMSQSFRQRSQSKSEEKTTEHELLAGALTLLAGAYNMDRESIKLGMN